MSAISLIPDIPIKPVRSINNVQSSAIPISTQKQLTHVPAPLTKNIVSVHDVEIVRKSLFNEFVSNATQFAGNPKGMVKTALSSAGTSILTAHLDDFSSTVGHLTSENNLVKPIYNKYLAPGTPVRSLIESCATLSGVDGFMDRYTNLAEDAATLLFRSLWNVAYGLMNSDLLKLLSRCLTGFSPKFASKMGLMANKFAHTGHGVMALTMATASHQRTSTINPISLGLNVLHTTSKWTSNHTTALADMSHEYGTHDSIDPVAGDITDLDPSTFVHAKHLDPVSVESYAGTQSTQGVDLGLVDTASPNLSVIRTDSKQLNALTLLKA